MENYPKWKETIILEIWPGPTHFPLNHDFGRKIKTWNPVGRLLSLQQPVQIPTIYLTLWAGVGSHQHTRSLEALQSDCLNLEGEVHSPCKICKCKPSCWSVPKMGSLNVIELHDNWLYHHQAENIRKKKRWRKAFRHQNVLWASISTAAIHFSQGAKWREDVFPFPTQLETWPWI